MAASPMAWTRWATASRLTRRSAGVNTAGRFSFNADDQLQTGEGGDIRRQRQHAQHRRQGLRLRFREPLTDDERRAVTVAYDAFGNRVAKTVNGVTTEYLVDDLNPTGYPQLIEELIGGAVTRQYTYGPQRISVSVPISPLELDRE